MHLLLSYFLSGHYKKRRLALRMRAWAVTAICLCFVFCTVTAHRTATLRRWDTYSIGDCFKFGDSWRCPIDMYREQWPHSLATKFLEHIRDAPEFPGDDERTAIMAELVQLMPAGPIRPLAGECAVHLRLGDVIESSAESVAAMWANQTMYIGPTGDTRGYVYPKTYYEQALRDLAPSRVMIVAGLTHYDSILGHRNSTQGKKGLAYLHRVKGFWETALGASRVRIRVHYPPDVALKQLVDSECFVPGGGGFSEIAEKIRERMAQLD